MDPVSLASLIGGSIGLAVQCGGAVKSLNSIAGQYKNAKITIVSMVQNLETIQLAWNRIGKWSEDYLPLNGFQDEDFMLRLQRFLDVGSLVMDALEEELRAYDPDHCNFVQRSRLVWNKDIFQSHQNRVRDQAVSMTLLLQAIQL